MAKSKSATSRLASVSPAATIAPARRPGLTATMRPWTSADRSAVRSASTVPWAATWKVTSSARATVTRTSGGGGGSSTTAGFLPLLAICTDT
jgi:hypothetical protein